MNKLITYIHTHNSHTPFRGLGGFTHNSHSPFRGLGGFAGGFAGGLLGLLMLASCSGGNDAPTLPDAAPIGIDTTEGLSFAVGRTSRAYNDGCGEAAQSRASDETDADSWTAILPEVMGVLCTTDINSTPVLFSNTRIFYNADGDAYKALPADYDWGWPAGFVWPVTEKWPYNNVQYWDSSWSLADLAQRKTYQFYAYAPHSKFENTTVEMTDMQFGSMNSFKLGKIPPLSSHCFMISKQIEERKSGIKPVFDMLNLSARICLRLKVGDQYSRIRKIRIKEITINDRTENSAVYYKCEYKLNVPDTDPNKLTFSADGSYVPASPNAVIPVIPIFNDAQGLLLTTTYRQFGSLYCMPQNLENITMNVLYDVYDMEPDRYNPDTGELLNEPIRANQRATNNVTIGLTVQAGYYYNVNIVVSPDYLYVLSDNDIEPDVVINPAN